MDTPTPARTRMPLWLRWMPRRGVSRTLGWLGRRRGGPFLQWFLRWYCKHYGADLSEAAKTSRKDYRTFLSFFTRALRADARPMPDDPQAIVSPADCRVYTAGSLADGTLVQAKGVDYSLADLLGDAQTAEALRGGRYVVMYLAPGDYHRFHWPFDGTVTSVRHLPGDLWPVNDRAVERVPGLFVRNERIAVTGTLASGAPFAYVPVGALNVGSIRLEFHDVRTNRRKQRARAWEVDVTARRGDPFGWFEFGSSIVLAVGPDGGTLEDLARDTKLRVGQPIGALAPAPT